MANSFDAILLDIEGTTTPIDFVHKTLFPYARSRVDAFIGEHLKELSAEIEKLADEKLNEPEYSSPLMIDSAESISAFLKYLIDNDRKSTPLKAIQGMIWKEGYESGELLSKVFDDVPEAFERWRSEGKTIAIYSSGSVLAQKLLFRYTDHGDLTPYISNYFDTTTGHKREASSYKQIAGSLGFDPRNIAFVSDIPAELDAASSSGMLTFLAVRPGNAPVERFTGYRTVMSLLETDLT